MIRILVAEPISLIREGLIAIIGRETDIEITAVVRHGQEVIPAARKSKPHVVLLAASFPGYDGTTLARALHTALPDCRCAILSKARRLRDLQRAVTADVDGFLVHDCPAEFLIEALRQMADGNKIIDSNLTFSALDHGVCPLTTREADALRAAAQGATTSEIGLALSLAEGTVRNYLSRAIAKTGARNRVDAIRIADEHGWLLRQRTTVARAAIWGGMRQHIFVIYLSYRYLFEMCGIHHKMMTIVTVQAHWSYVII